MAIDWDAMVLVPLMGLFGEGDPADQSTWPIYMPLGLASFRLPDAVFDAEYQHVALDREGTPSTSSRPVLGVRTALFPRFPAQNDSVQIAGGEYRGQYIVTDVQPDGHGYAKLILMRQAAP